MLDKITKALGGSSSLATAPTKGLLDRIDTLDLKAAEEGHAARANYEGSRVAQGEYGEAQALLAILEREGSPQAEAQRAEVNRRGRAMEAANTRKIQTICRQVWGAVQPIADKIRDGTLEYTFDPPEPELPKGARTLVEAIAAIRAKRRALLAELSRVKAALDPDLKRLVEGKVASAVERPRVEIREGGEDFGITWPMHRIHAESTITGGIPKAPDAAALACWLGRDQIIEEIGKQVDEALASADMVMSPADKRNRLRQIDAELAELERQEAALVWAGLEAGESVYFRADADPRAILGIV